MAGEFQGCHEDFASERALESGWESRISLVEEVEMQNYLSRNVFRAFTFGAEISDRGSWVGLVRTGEGLLFLRFFLSVFDQLAQAF